MVTQMIAVDMNGDGCSLNAESDQQTLHHYNAGSLPADHTATLLCSSTLVRYDWVELDGVATENQEAAAMKELEINPEQSLLSLFPIVSGQSTSNNYLAVIADKLLIKEKISQENTNEIEIQQVISPLNTYCTLSTLQSDTPLISLLDITADQPMLFIIKAGRLQHASLFPAKHLNSPISQTKIKTTLLRYGIEHVYCVGDDLELDKFSNFFTQINMKTINNQKIVDHYCPADNENKENTLLSLTAISLSAFTEQLISTCLAAKTSRKSSSAQLKQKLGIIIPSILLTIALIAGGILAFLPHDNNEPANILKQKKHLAKKQAALKKLGNGYILTSTVTALQGQFQSILAKLATLHETQVWVNQVSIDNGKVSILISTSNDQQFLNWHHGLEKLNISKEWAITPSKSATIDLLQTETKALTKREKKIKALNQLLSKSVHFQKTYPLRAERWKKVEIETRAKLARLTGVRSSTGSIKKKNVTPASRYLLQGTLIPVAGVKT